MTSGEAEEASEAAGAGMEGGGGGGRRGSFTTLSTIAIQAGQSQIVVSVLKSGAQFHLQLVQVHPGLCEIGSNQEENQTLIQEQQQLLAKLKKHESGVLSLLEEKKKKKEEELYTAMEASLSEGWFLLLGLMERRQEVLMLAADFYCRALQFSVSIDAAEELQRSEQDKLTELQLTYNSVRRDLLVKSLQVLSSSDALLHQLRQLQRTEALQRTGAVLQHPDSSQEGEGGECSQCSQSAFVGAERLEQLVELLQDRRRRVDQAVRLRLQQLENGIVVRQWEQQHKQLQLWFQSRAEVVLSSDQLGSSLPEAQQLLSHHRQFEAEAQDWTGKVEKLLAGVSELQPATEKVRDLQQLQEQLCSRMKLREARLQDSNTFFSSANQALAVLSAVQSQVEALKLHTLSLFELSRKQEELQATIQEATSLTLQSGNRLLQHNTDSEQVVGVQRMMGKIQGLVDSLSRECHALQALTNQRQQLMTSCQDLIEKVSGWLKRSSNVLCTSTEPGQKLCEAEDALNTHLQLHTQAEAAGRDADNMKQILDQIRALQNSGTEETGRTSRTSTEQPDRTSTPASDRTSPRPPSRTSSLSPLKALTEQLKRAGRSSPPAAEQTSRTTLSGSDLPGRVALVLEELQTLNMKIDSNLQLLRPYVTFLRMAEWVEEEIAALREICSRRTEQEEKKTGTSNTSSCSAAGPSVPVKQQADVHWQATLQTFLTAQELGNNFINAVTMVGRGSLDVQFMVSVVRQTLEHLNRGKQEVMELFTQQETDRKNCRKYRERLTKTVQDLQGVSELLAACSHMELGCGLQICSQLDRFSRARPHFTKLDADVEFIVKNQELLTLRGGQEREEEGGAVKEKEEEQEVCELLKLHQKVKQKIQQCETLLGLASSFHQTARQLEVLLQAEPLSSASCSDLLQLRLREQRERRQQVQDLFRETTSLGQDVCTACTHCGETGFSVVQLQERLVSLDRQFVSWSSEASRQEEKLQGELLCCLLTDDISELRDSFKELKKRFNNLKFNYLKRNDRTRNMKAVRNQLQQIQLYVEKLQALKKRLQGLIARLGSEVKDGGTARETENNLNELQRQMGEFERSIDEHRQTLDMTCRLQQAMEEYQFWCEEASATIVRVGKFSSQCRTREAVSVLYQQFEKFVWPTVPQQEERINQITELAVRLHGAEEGRRYIEKTVNKHTEVVDSIRELCDRLVQLEAKLQLENLKQQSSKDEEDEEEKKNIKNNKEKELHEEREMEQKRENEAEERKKDREREKEENGKQQMDNRSTQEAADMFELKETGHTPELTVEYDGKEVPIKKQTAANRKPPLCKSRSQEADRQTVVSESSERSSRAERCTSSSLERKEEYHTSSYSCTQSLSLSHSPAETDRRVHMILSQTQHIAEPRATPPPSVTAPRLSDTHKELQKKEKQEAGEEDGSGSYGLNPTHPQDASGGGLVEADLQQQEVMTEDYLSNDEYECASPDDISLPPLSETPESNMVQSDVEESFCFSSHSVHINQYSHHAQSEPSGTSAGTGVVGRERTYSQTESHPSPTTGLHSSTRFRSESSSFVQRPLAAHGPSLVSNTLCTILKTKVTSLASFPQNPGLSTGCPEPNLHSGSKPVHQSNTSDTHSYQDNSLPQPQTETPSQTDTGPKASGLIQSPSLLQDIRPPSQTQTSSCPQAFTSPDSAILQASSGPQGTGFPKSSTTFPQNSKIFPQDKSLPQSFPSSSSGLPQDEAVSETSKGTPSTAKPQTNSTSTAVTQQTVNCQSFPSDSCFSLSQASSSLSSKESPCSQASKGLPQVPQATVPSEPDSISNISISSSTITSSNSSSSRQSHQTVFSLHESLTSTLTHQCVHDPGVTPSPTQPRVQTPPQPQPEAQTQALAQQANSHAASSPPPHLLTSDQDPDVCRPMAIREEIRLTPQIQGPSQPPPPLPPQAQASKPGPPCFTRPLSRATVMEGSPVTLEVEVSGHPEPTLTWFKDGEVLAAGLGRTLAAKDNKHSLFIPAASDSDSGRSEAQATNRHGSLRSAATLQVAARNSSSDRWLIAEVYDIISLDWHTWFGTVCVLLWLLYLVIHT